MVSVWCVVTEFDACVYSALYYFDQKYYLISSRTCDTNIDSVNSMVMHMIEGSAMTRIASSYLLHYVPSTIVCSDRRTKFLLAFRSGSLSLLGLLDPPDRRPLHYAVKLNTRKARYSVKTYTKQRSSNIFTLCHHVTE